MKPFVLAVCLFVLSGCSFPATTGTSGTTERLQVEVVQVIDGDTIKIDYEGKETTVRYLLIDTPETNHPRFGEQPLGREATARNRELLMAAAQIEVEFDVGERFDDYGRMLAYLYADGESVQKRLLTEGLARVAYIFPPNTRYVDEFREAETLAKDYGLGVWQFENYATDRGFNSTAYSSESMPNENDCDIKGNINRSGNKIYHMPGSPSYDQTNPEQWFCTEQEAQDAGFRKAGR